MTCKRIDLGDGDFMITCSRGVHRNCKCGARATLRCDFELRGSKLGQTCDAWLCARCAVKLGADGHYCQPHKRLHDREMQP